MREYDADTQAIVAGEHYRFTVLTSRMIRMEYSEKDSFTDLKTQVVVNRSFSLPDYHVERTAEGIVISTAHLRLKYNEKKFSPEGLRVDVSGQHFAYSTKWNYGDVPRDLKGTARTLDQADGEIPLEPGVLSAFGWTLLDDSDSLLIREDGWVEQRQDENAKDIYFFGYGRDYLECLRDFHRLTGNVPLLPRFALGNWWSRYYKYSEASYLELMDRFEQEKIPFTVAVIDMDWHLTEIDPKYGTGWTGYTWNKELFPDPRRFMSNLHDRGMHVTLNVHPADGVRAFEDCYSEFADYMGIDPQSGEPIAFEIGNPKFVKGYFDCVHRPLEEQGVDFWWIDWQQGTTSGIKGLDPLWMLNHYHYLDNQKKHSRGMIFSRYAGPGSHRYPIGFSGDTIITWDSLRFQPYFTLTASNIGYGWWSHDIGGHMRGIKNDELATRWLQFGVFSPIMRLHSSRSEFNGKEPWRYHSAAMEVMKHFLRLRHKMIPYLYTMNLIASKESVPLVQPLYYHSPQCMEAYLVKNEYYFGSELLVCPITEPADRETDMAKFAGWIPEGVWADCFTGMLYEGGRRFDFYRGLESMPVLLREGGILALDAGQDGNRIENPEELEILVNVMGSGAFSLWEDNGAQAEYKEEDWVKTTMHYQSGEQAQFTIEPAQGNLSVLPEKRGYQLRFYGVDANTLPVLFDGENEEEILSDYDEKRGILTVRIPKTPVSERVSVRLKNSQAHDNQKMGRIFDYLNRAEISFDSKEVIYRIAGKLAKGTESAYVMGELQQLSVRSEILGPILEIISSKI